MFRIQYAMALTVALVLGACTSAPKQEAPPIATTPPKEVASAPVVHEPLPQQPAPPVQEAGPTPPPVPLAAIPPKALYVCTKLVKGAITQSAIEFIPKVDNICRRHPEMLPCQYERDICRRNGGRVFAADGTEITMATEAEYDKNVYRVRFRAD